MPVQKKYYACENCGSEWDSYEDAAACEKTHWSMADADLVQEIFLRRDQDEDATDGDVRFPSKIVFRMVVNGILTDIIYSHSRDYCVPEKEGD